MPKRIEVPGHGIIEFPDDMGDDQIAQAIKTNILKQGPSEEYQRLEKTGITGIRDIPTIIGEGYRQAKETIGGMSRKPVVVPALIGAGGELLKQAGAVGELATDRAQPLTQAGRAIVGEAKQFNPQAATVGEYGSYIAPYVAAMRALRAVAPAVPGVRAVVNPATSLGRAGEAAVLGGTLGGLTTPGTSEDRTQAALLGAALGAGAELALPYLAGAAKGAYQRFRGQEPPRAYSPQTGLPVGPEYKTSRMMTPQEQVAFPRQESIPLPGTAGQQTGARIYEYLTSLRPYADVAGASFSPGLGLAGELLGKGGMLRAAGLPAKDIPGFRSPSLLEIATKGGQEALISNRLQGMMPQPNIYGLGSSVLRPQERPPGPAAPPPPGPVQPPPQPRAAQPIPTENQMMLPLQNDIIPRAQDFQLTPPPGQTPQPFAITPPTNAIQSGFARELNVPLLPYNKIMYASPTGEVGRSLQPVEQAAFQNRYNPQRQFRQETPAPTGAAVPEQIIPPVQDNRQAVIEAIRRRAAEAEAREQLSRQAVVAQETPTQQTPPGPVIPQGMEESVEKTLIPSRPSLAEIREKIASNTKGAEQLARSEARSEASKAAQAPRRELEKDIKDYVFINKKNNKLSIDQDMVNDLAKERNISLDWSTAPDITNMKLTDGKTAMKKWLYGEMKGTEKTGMSASVAGQKKNKMTEELSISTPYLPEKTSVDETTFNQLVDSMRNRPYMSGIERSKERTKSTGEVFTPTKLVDEILSNMDQKIFKDPSKTFLDPAAGDGQFLSEVVLRKIQQGSTHKQALETTYGVDIKADNVKILRDRLLAGNESLRPVAENNLLVGNMLNPFEKVPGQSANDHKRMIEVFGKQEIDKLAKSTKKADKQKAQEYKIYANRLNAKFEE